MSKVYVILEGGCLCAVVSSDRDTQVVVIDRDEAEGNKRETRRQAQLDARIEKLNYEEKLWYVY